MNNLVSQICDMYISKTKLELLIDKAEKTKHYTELLERKEITPDEYKELTDDLLTLEQIQKDALSVDDYLTVTKALDTIKTAIVVLISL